MELFTTLLALLMRCAYFAIALFGIGFLIGFHEFGHFIFCKIFGIKTPSFSIGFGPKIFSRKIDGTEFILSAIPLGGFVEIAGAAEMGQGEQKDAHSTASDSFATKPYYQKFLVMMGGILCNLLFAYTAFIFLSLVGIPKTALMHPVNGTTQVKFIEPESAAAQAFIQEGDVITKLNNVDVQNKMPLLIETAHGLANQLVPVTLLRDGVPVDLMITLDAKEINGTTVGSLGLEFDLAALPPQSFFAAIKQGIWLTNSWIAQTVNGFLSMFKKRDLKGVGGPVVIISMLTKGATTSLKIFIILLAIISINLAILNLIPLPILDGGQLLFYTIEAIIGRPLPIKVREYIHIASWLLVLGLVLYLSVFDIANLASPLIENIKQFLGFGR